MKREKIRWQRSVLLILGLLVFSCLCMKSPMSAMNQVSAAGSEVSAYASSSLSKPTLNRPVRTEKSTVRLSWSKVSGASKYKVYRSKYKSGPYHKLALTTKTSYTDTKGVQGRIYYYKVVAIGKSSTGKTVKSPDSRIVSAKVRVTPKRIAYVGDSIMEGFSTYGVISNTSAHKVIAKVGIQTYNFVSGEYMTKLLNYNPDRIYISLGINGIGREYNASYYAYTVENYKKIIDKCLNKNKNVEIIIIPVTPVGRVATVSQACRKAMNSLLANMYKKYYSEKPNVKYWSVDKYLAGSDGYLLSTYNAGDGVHWTAAGYRMMYKKFKNYAKNW